MLDLNAMAVFAKVAACGSFSEAGRRLKMPVSTVSRRVADLEAQLGTRLIERTTRQLRLTEIGSEVLERCQRGLEEFEAAHLLVTNQRVEVSGSLRVSAPPSLSDPLVVPLAHTFRVIYPNVRLDVFVTERMVDLIVEGIDIALRVGPLRDSTLIARSILAYPHVLVASPDYLACCGSPKTPQDLAAYNIVAFASWPDEPTWTLSNGSDSFTVAIEPCLTINDYVGLVRAALDGVGIADMPAIICAGHLRDGSLVEVLPNWRFPNQILSVVHLSNRNVSRRVRLFIDHCVQHAPKLFPDLLS